MRHLLIIEELTRRDNLEINNKSDKFVDAKLIKKNKDTRKITLNQMKLI